MNNIDRMEILFAVGHFIGVIVVYALLSALEYWFYWKVADSRLKRTLRDAALALRLPEHALTDPVHLPKFRDWSADRHSSDLLANRVSDLFGYIITGWSWLGQAIQLLWFLGVAYFTIAESLDAAPAVWILIFVYGATTTGTILINFVCYGLTGRHPWQARNARESVAKELEDAHLRDGEQRELELEDEDRAFWEKKDRFEPLQPQEAEDDSLYEGVRLDQGLDVGKIKKNQPLGFEMFGWGKRKKYRQDVMTKILVITAMVENGSEQAIHNVLPGLDELLDQKFDEGADPSKFAMEIGGIIFTLAIEELGAEVRQRSAQQLAMMADGQEVIGELEPVISRFLLSSRLAEGWLKRGEIDESDLELFNDEVFGALAGIDREERSRNRIFDFLGSLDSEFGKTIRDVRGKQ